jgi:dihydropteroate synthase
MPEDFSDDLPDEVALEPQVLRLRDQQFDSSARLVMAVVNRTPDSFFDKGSTFTDEAAMDAVSRAVGDGASIVDIGGVKAGPGDNVGLDEELNRTVDFVAAVRDSFPDVLVSVDTWRHEVADAVCRAGADLINDAWGGFDPEVADVAAAHNVGLVCTHTGGTQPRTRPHRVEYEDVMGAVIDFLRTEAARAEARGVRRDRIVVDPGHDFGKNTRHSLEVTRRLGELVSSGRPVLVSLSNKDFVGETLDAPVPDRLVGTLAATAISGWLGARIFRAHQVRETAQVLTMVRALAGLQGPVVARRGLA